MDASPILAQLTIGYKVTLISFVTCWGIYFISDVLFARLLPFYSKLSKGDRTEWGSRVVSTLHAFVATYGSFLALYTDHNVFTQDPFGRCTQCDWWLKVSIGYFLYDMVLVMTEKQIRSMGTIIHHILGIVGFSASMAGGQVLYFTLLQNSTELTTPFVNNRWFLAASKQSNSQAYMINGLVMTFAFVMYRAVIVPIAASYAFYAHWDKYQRVTIVLYFLLPFCVIGITLLNFYWTSLMVKGLLRHLSKSIAKAPPATRKSKKHA